MSELHPHDTDCRAGYDPYICRTCGLGVDDPIHAVAIDAKHLDHQREWSLKTFGPGPRTKGIADHIQRELAEVAEKPYDLSEWADVIILAFDGALRSGWTSQQIIDAVKSKQQRNEARTWPDWRLFSQDVAIEHDRTADA